MKKFVAVAALGVVLAGCQMPGAEEEMMHDHDHAEIDVVVPEVIETPVVEAEPAVEAEMPAEVDTPELPEVVEPVIAE